MWAIGTVVGLKGRGKSMLCTAQQTPKRHMSMKMQLNSSNDLSLFPT